MSNDRDEIADLLIRYATALDTRDFELLASCFTEDAVADYGPLGGRNEGLAAIRDAVGVLRGFDRTQHLLGNIVVDLEADEAQTTCYLHARHVINADDGQSLFTVGGVYRDHVVRTPAGWRIAQRTLDAIWQSGDSALIEVAMRRS